MWSSTLKTFTSGFMSTYPHFTFKKKKKNSFHFVILTGEIIRKQHQSVDGCQVYLYDFFFKLSLYLPNNFTELAEVFFVPPPSPESPTVPELFKDFVKQKFMLRWFEDYKRDGWIFVLVETLQEQQPSEQEEGGTGLQVWLVSSEREQRSGVTLKKFFFFFNLPATLSGFFEFLWFSPTLWVCLPSFPWGGDGGLDTMAADTVIVVLTFKIFFEKMNK